LATDAPELSYGPPERNNPMEPVVELKELTERICLAAERANSANYSDPGFKGSWPESASREETLPQFITAAINDGTLDNLERLLPRAHQKNAVSGSVPKLLRPLFRNQGGFNAVLLNVAECLVSLARQIVERMGTLHEWADSVGQEMARNRSWVAATEIRLQTFKDERLIQIEARLHRLEQSNRHDESRRLDNPSNSGAVREPTEDQPRLRRAQRNPRRARKCWKQKSADWENSSSDSNFNSPNRPITPVWCTVISTGSANMSKRNWST